MTTPAQPHPGELAATTLAMLLTLVIVLVSGFVLLILTGHDTMSYVLFVAGPLVTTVTAALIGRRVKAVEVVAQRVEAQTNGLLSAQLAGIHDHLDAQTTDLSGARAAPPADETPPIESGRRRAVPGQSDSDAYVRGPISPSTTRP